MLGKLIGKLTGGGGGRAPGSRIDVRIPGLPDLDNAFDALEQHVDEMGASIEGLSLAELKSRLGEQEELSRFVVQLCTVLNAAGTLSMVQANAAVGRATSVVRLAGDCERYPTPFSSIDSLPVAAIFDALAGAVERHGIDRALHDALKILAGSLATARLKGADPWVERIVDLADLFREPEDGPIDLARMMEAYILDAIARPDHLLGLAPKVQNLSAGKRIFDADTTVQRDVLLEAFKALAEAINDNAKALRKHGSDGEWYDRSRHQCHAIREMAGRLLGRKLPFEEQHLAGLYRTILDAGIRHVGDWPMAGIIGATEKYVKANGLSDGALKAGLQQFLKKTAGRTLEHGHVERIERIIAKSEGKLLIPHSALGLAITGWVNEQDEPARKLWLGLMQLGLQTAGKAKPVAKWSGLAAGIVENLGEDEIVERLTGWLKDPGITMDGPEPTGDIVKGMIWAVAKGGDDKLASMLGRLCETCYKKVPGVGPANVKLGNACIYALGEMSGERAVAELVRLRSRIKFNQGRNQLDKALGEVAERAGLTVADLEEIALPTFGLDGEGARRVALGEVTAEIRIAGSDEVALSWTGADGKPRKSIPASVKADHADELKSLRAEIKEIKGLLAGQRWRLESLYLAQRSWPLADWRKRYLDHPLMANLARRLIWNIGDAVVIPAADGFVGADGKPVEPAKSANVSLWHPIEAKADEVLAWRRRLAAQEVTQPFKQAHREVYVLTDAERTTEIYSNRFAAHVIRQHQLNALCQARAWRFGQFLIWDSTGSLPTRPLPGFGLQAEFWVDPIDYDQHTEATGAYLFMATDQVRFVNDQETAVPLAEVPAILLTEVLRDVDLFIGVASIANNPEWQDGGSEGRHREYWWGRSFGEIGARGDVRHAVLADLLPKLKVAGQCELTEKFLIVRGTKRTYKIHLGSGNILMTPNDQYLCIVQDVRGLSKGGDNVRLPFEGDRTLALILSKAFMLAADDKITDKTILSQIGG